MINIGILGSSGRVGSLLIDDIQAQEGIKLTACHVNKGLKREVPDSTIITNDMKTFMDACDLIIDFSTPIATQTLLEHVVEHNKLKPLVIATTGLSKHQQNLLVEASQKVPVLYATNMSLGIALLNNLVSLASKTLKEFDCEIVEQHHRYKIDAPSGTALTLAQHAATARDLDLDAVRVSGRDGEIGQRTNDEIAVMSLRGGDVVGRHTVGLYNEGEFIELHHTATSRHTFSKGAIKAAMWLSSKEEGLYSIKDCLGL